VVLRCRVSLGCVASEGRDGRGPVRMPGSRIADAAISTGDRPIHLADC